MTQDYLNIPYRKTKNEYIKGYNKTKAIVSAQGRLFVDCLVQSVNRGKLITTKEIGEASGNMKDFDRHYMRALDNAIYKHISSGGISGARVIKTYNHWIKYFNDDVKVKREYVKPKQKVVEVPSYTRIVKKEVTETKEIKVKSHIRNGKKIKGYTRTIKREITKFDEELVKGYTYKKLIGKGKYESVVRYKGEEVLREPYRRRKTSTLDKELEMINKAKNKAMFVDRI